MKIGITGQSGFIGSHLYNFLGTKKDITRIPFEDRHFDSENKMNNFVKRCDVIVHLAAINRHEDPQYLYDRNINLVKRLISALESTGSKPHILFSSSIQEKQNNLYGQSKKEGRSLLEDWAKRNNAQFSGLIIPNVFGPFGKPHYNSVVSTFCHQIIRDEIPELKSNNEINLIYVNELTAYIYKRIKQKRNSNTADNDSVESFLIPHSKTISVSSLLTQLKHYTESYCEKGVIPDLEDAFNLNLFNTFHCYMPHDSFPKKLTPHRDERGSFVEVVRANTGGQFSCSTTKPGVTRGEHYHIRKAERFTVIQGKAIIQIRRIGTEEILEYNLSAEEPSFVDIPIWHTHNITNTGENEMVCLFWTNELYDPEDPDTFYEPVTRNP